MSMVKEFKEFAMKGNVVDLAVGVIIGAAFGKIVSSLVADVFMPVIGLVVGGVNFSDMAITLKAAVDKEHPAVLLAYGKFLQASFDFLIVAFVIFLVVKAMNTLKKKEEAASPAASPEPSAEVKLLGEIRDLLKK